VEELDITVAGLEKEMDWSCWDFEDKDCEWLGHGLDW
jgi:hypothetical protein